MTSSTGVHAAAERTHHVCSSKLACILISLGRVHLMPLGINHPEPSYTPNGWRTCVAMNQALQ